MKRNIFEERQRILEMMSSMDDKIIISELDQKYLNYILDKINTRGKESLNDYEKSALEKMGRGEDVKQPDTYELDDDAETLRFTTKDKKESVKPKDAGLKGKPQLRLAYIRGEAEKIAGFDQPHFLDGDFSQLDKPMELQKIIMVLPFGEEYECTATVDESGQRYIIDLKKEEEV